MRYGGGDRIRTYVGFPRRSYSPLHLTALPPLLISDSKRVLQPI